MAAVTGELASLGDPGDVRAFLCGGPDSVTAMRRVLFLAGMPLRHICADEFLPAARAATGRPGSRHVPGGQVGPDRGQ